MPEDKDARDLTAQPPACEDGAAPSDSSGGMRRYRAFVSYRHADVDSKVAAAVQSGLERFHVPKAMRAAWGSAHIAPVFRDKEELPVSTALGDDIDAALRSAEAFVLICSPRTQQSSWVAREIDLYLKYHGRGRVFVVLAEGEPADVVPQKLLYETRQVEGPDGATHEELVEMEPLACDFRASARRERRTELTRLAAAILGVSFDALNRRAQRRRMRIGASIAAVITAVALGVAGYALWSNARIHENYQQALQQQSQYLTTSAQELLNNGDRLAAIELASAALPAEGEDRPLYPAALRTLAEAVRAYDDGQVDREWAAAGLAAKYQMAGSVRAMATSEDEHYLAVTDNRGNLCVWDLKTDEPVFRASYSSENPNGTALAITDDGLLALADSSTISCFDIHGTEDALWSLNIVREIEGGDDWESSHAPDYCLQLADQKRLIALGNTAAYLLDLRTGSVKKSVAYEKDMPNNVSFYPERLEGAWEPASKSLVVHVVRAVSQDSGDGSSSDYTSEYQTRLLCFEDGSSDVLEGVRYATGAQFVDENTLLVSGYDRQSGYGPDAERRSVFYAGDFQQITQYPYDTKVACIDLDGNEVLWAHETPACQPSVCDTFLSLEGKVAGYEGRRLVAHSFSNVCELHDLDTGEVLRRWETASSLECVWPSVDDDRTVEGLVLEGMLVDGGAFALRILDDAPQSFSNPSYYKDVRFVSSECVRLEEGMLLSSDNTVLRYADALKGDHAEELHGGTEQYAKLYSTACGVLLSEMVVDDESYSVGYKFSLLDSAGGGIAWSKEFVRDDEFAAPSVIGDPTGSDHLFLFSLSLGAGDPDRLEVVDLAKGEAVTYEVVHGFEGELSEDAHLLGLDAVVSSHYALSAIDETQYVEATTEDGETYAQEENVAHLAVTDLLTGKSTMLPVAELSDAGERFSESHFDLEGCSLSPTGTHAVIPTEDERDESSGFSVKPEATYGVLDVATHKLNALSAKIQTDVYNRGDSSVLPVVWSDDGTRFVALAEGGLAVFDTRGTQLATLPVGNSQVLSMYFYGEKLMMVCAEEDSVFVLALDSATGEVLGRNLLRDEESDFLGPDTISWIASSSSDRDPGELCLLAGDTMYVLSLDPFGVCQVVNSCVGYDDAARAFVVSKNVPSGEEGSYIPAYYAYERHSIDDLLAWGREEVGASGMTNAERQNYGLDASGA